MKLYSIRGFLYIGVVTTLLLSVLGAAAQEPTAEPPDTANRVVVDFLKLVGGDVTLQGLNASQSTWVQLPANWEVDKEVYVNLQYMASPLLNRDRASMTVAVNGQNITSFIPVADGEVHEVALIIPPNLLYQGAGFLIEMKGYLRVTETECELSSIPAQWLRVSQNSTVSLVPDNSPTPPGLENLATSLVPLSPFLSKSPIIVVLPENPTAEVMTVAAQVTLRLGNRVRGSVPAFQVRSASTLTDEERETANLIVIGSPADNALVETLIPALSYEAYQNGQFVTPEGVPVPETDGVIHFISSPWNINNAVLILTGNSAAGVQQAGRAFGQQALFNALEGDYKFVGTQSASLPTDPIPWVSEETTLKDTGFTSQNVYGLGSSSIWLTLRRPAGWQLEDGAQLTLKLGSSLLDQGSNVGIFIDDVFIGTLDTANRDYIEETLPLPAALLNNVWRNSSKTDMQMRLEVVNIMPYDDCQQVDPQSLWTYVDSSSAFVTPHTFMALPNLIAFPYPLVSTQTQYPVNIILPPYPSAEELEMLLQLTTALGKSLFSDLPLTILTADQVGENLPEGHVVILGERQRQPLIEQILPTLPPISPEEVYEVIGDTNTGVVQEAIKPGTEDQIIILIYGDSTRSATLALQSLTQDASLADQITTMEETDSVRLIRLKAE